MKRALMADSSRGDIRVFLSQDQNDCFLLKGADDTRTYTETISTISIFSKQPKVSMFHVRRKNMTRALMVFDNLRCVLIKKRFFEVQFQEYPGDSVFNLRG